MRVGEKTTQRLFILCAALAAIFFFWSRLDFSSHIYYFGDGNVIVEIIRLMLSSHNWDPNWLRLKDVITLQPQDVPLVKIPESVGVFYNLSGYSLVGAAICKIIYSTGFMDWPIQSILRGLNIALQIATLLLLFLTGKKLLSKNAGIIAALLFVIFPLVVMEAHYERPETWLCFLLTAVVCCCVYFHEAPARYTALIGVLIGLSAATKTNQLFLLMLPALLLLHFQLTSATGTAAQKIQKMFALGFLVLFCTSVTVYIHTPFLITHANEVIAGLKDQANFYSTANYPYSEEHYSFLNQLFVSFRYYWFTLGSLWCLFLLTGTALLVKEFAENPSSKKIINLMVVLPILFLFFFSALLIVFAERTLSSIEGLLCLVTAFGFVRSMQQLEKIKSTKKIFPVLTAAIILVMLFTPLRIDYLFVDHYIKHPDKPQRVAFQDILKKDFQKFWIKNVYYSFKIQQQLPEKPEKAPRIYQIDDLNEHWTKNYLALLEQNGFRRIGVYCSEFFDMPPNTLTIYHAAAKNHYYVRADEWPAEIATDYFKTNCP